MKLNEIFLEAADRYMKQLQDAADEINDIVLDHMDKSKPSKYVEQIQKLLEKSPFQEMPKPDLEQLLIDIGKIAKKNLDSEFEGGRAVNPNDELRIYSIVSNIIGGV